jgi:predicted transcriptional regulator
MSEEEVVLLNANGVMRCKLSDLEVLVSQGLVEKDGDVYRVTDFGRRFYDAVLKP